MHIHKHMYACIHKKTYTYMQTYIHYVIGVLAGDKGAHLPRRIGPDFFRRILVSQTVIIIML